MLPYDQVSVLRFMTPWWSYYQSVSAEADSKEAAYLPRAQKSKGNRNPGHILKGNRNRRHKIKGDLKPRTQNLKKRTETRTQNLKGTRTEDAIISSMVRAAPDS